MSRGCNWALQKARKRGVWLMLVSPAMEMRAMDGNRSCTIVRTVYLSLSEGGSNLEGYPWS